MYYLYVYVCEDTFVYAYVCVITCMCICLHVHACGVCVCVCMLLYSYGGCYRRHLLIKQCQHPIILFMNISGRKFRYQRSQQAVMCGQRVSKIARPFSDMTPILTVNFTIYLLKPININYVVLIFFCY